MFSFIKIIEIFRAYYMSFLRTYDRNTHLRRLFRHAVDSTPRVIPILSFGSNVIYDEHFTARLKIIFIDYQLCLGGVIKKLMEIIRKRAIFSLLLKKARTIRFLMHAFFH